MKGLDEVKQKNLALQHECDQLAAKIKDKNSQVNSYTKQVTSIAFFWQLKEVQYQIGTKVNQR